MSQAANKPITSFNWYQVFGGFYRLSRDSMVNRFSQPNLTFINPGLRSHYSHYSTISEKMKFHLQVRASVSSSCKRAHAL